jgi:hypothetical protein
MKLNEFVDTNGEFGGGKNDKEGWWAVDQSNFVHEGPFQSKAEATDAAALLRRDGENATAKYGILGAKRTITPKTPPQA